ncbi:MAG: serine kinase [Actinomycetes bacterium]
MLVPGSEDREPTAVHDLMLAGAIRAGTRFGGPLDRRYRFGPQTVRLRFAGPEVADALGPALDHVRIADGPTDGPTDVTIDCWDSVSSGEPVSPLVALLLDRIDHDWLAWLTPRHEVRGFDNDRVATAFEPWSGILSTYDRTTARGAWWTQDATAVPSHERAAPLRSLLGWALGELGLQSVHAAAVGRTDGGVLLAGPGGSGKSSTALRGLADGLGHLADDYCLISTVGPPTAHSLYAVAKLDGPADLERLPEFGASVTNPERTGSEKLVIDVGRDFPDRVVTSFPIRAVVVPQVRAGAPTALAPMSSAAALRALGPTTMLQLPGAGSTAFRHMGDLVRAVPCFTLYLGPDAAAVTPLLESLLRP